MFRYRDAVLFSLVFAGFLHDVTLGQTVPAGRSEFEGFLMPPVAALESETVQKELRLTIEQSGHLKRVLSRVVDAQKKVGDSRDGDFASLSRDQKQARRAEFRKTRDEANLEAVQLLTNEQNVRLKQTRVWIANEQALFTREISGEFALSDEQKNLLVRLKRELSSEIRQISTPDEGTDEERLGKMPGRIDQLKKGFDGKFLEVLTAEQRAKLDSLRGPKIEVEKSEFPTTYPPADLRGRRPV